MNGGWISIDLVRGFFSQSRITAKVTTNTSAINVILTTCHSMSGVAIALTGESVVVDVGGVVVFGFVVVSCTSGVVPIVVIVSLSAGGVSTFVVASPFAVDDLTVVVSAGGSSLTDEGGQFGVVHTENGLC